MRITLTLRLDKSATGNPAHINHVEFGPIKAQHLKPDEIDDVFRATEFKVTEETGRPGGDLEEELSIGDTDRNTFFGARLP